MGVHDWGIRSNLLVSMLFGLCIAWFVLEHGFSTLPAGLKTNVDTKAIKFPASQVTDTNTKQRHNSRRAPIINSNNDRWAVVQVFDCGRPTYSVGILATNEAIQTWRESNPESKFDHIIVGWRCQCTTNAIGFSDPNMHQAIATMLAAGIKFYPSEDVSSYGAVQDLMKAQGARSTNDLHKLFNDPFRSYRQFGGKFAMWNLTQYSRLLYMDHDVVPMQDLTHLFHEANVRAPLIDCDHPIMGASDPASGYCLNSGVMVITPSQFHLENMLSELAKAAVEFDKTKRRISACYNFKDGRKLQGDQDFIQNYFESHQCFQSLTPFYNVMSILGKDHLKTDAYSPPFFAWLMSRPDTRRLVKAFHVGYPKPDMFNWKGPANQRFFNPPPGNYLSDTQKAVLSIFKTYWMRYLKATDRVCAAITTAEFPETEFSSSKDTCTSVYSKAFYEKGRNYVIQRCQGSRYNRSIDNTGGPFSDFLQSFSEDTRIPLWQDIL